MHNYKANKHDIKQQWSNLWNYKKQENVSWDEGDCN